MILLVNGYDIRLALWSMTDCSVIPLASDGGSISGAGAIAPVSLVTTNQSSYGPIIQSGTNNLGSYVQWPDFLRHPHQVLGFSGDLRASRNI